MTLARIYQSRQYYITLSELSYLRLVDNFFPQPGDRRAGDRDKRAEGASLELQQQQHQPPPTTITAATTATTAAAESVYDGEGGENNGRALAQPGLFTDDEKTAKLRDLSSECTALMTS